MAGEYDTTKHDGTEQERLVESVVIVSDLLEKKHEPPRDNTNKLTCAPSENSDQPGHPPSLISVFAVRSVGS